jgi:hypothetical protein
MKLVARFERPKLFFLMPAALIRISLALVRSGRALVPMLVLAPLTPAWAGTLFIGGTPPAAITEPNNYSFRPWATDSVKTTLKFSISNKPYWATFNSSNGVLSGPVRANQLGTYKNISISVSDGKQTTFMPAFSIAVVKAGSVPPAAGGTGPTIKGAPATSVAINSAYSFQPATTDPSGGKLIFSVKSKPAWATFSTTSGLLSGTPKTTDVGTDAGIVIGVTDGKSTASLAPFTISVTQIATGSATVSWVPPTQNTDGSVLKNLAGYDIKYGTSTTALTHTVQVTNPGLTRFVVTNLSPGTYYFGTLAYTTTGAQSALSALASKTIK